MKQDNTPIILLNLSLRNFFIAIFYCSSINQLKTVLFLNAILLPIHHKAFPFCPLPVFTILQSTMAQFLTSNHTLSSPFKHLLKCCLLVPLIKTIECILPSHPCHEIHPPLRFSSNTAHPIPSSKPAHLRRINTPPKRSFVGIMHQQQKLYSKWHIQRAPLLSIPEEH